MIVLICNPFCNILYSFVILYFMLLKTLFRKVIYRLYHTAKVQSISQQTFIKTYYVPDTVLSVGEINTNKNRQSLPSRSWQSNEGRQHIQEGWKGVGGEGIQCKSMVESPIEVPEQLADKKWGEKLCWAPSLNKVSGTHGPALQPRKVKNSYFVRIFLKAIL